MNEKANERRSGTKKLASSTQIARRSKTQSIEKA
jgi:hypothetical protein